MKSKKLKGIVEFEALFREKNLATLEEDKEREALVNMLVSLRQYASELDMDFEKALMLSDLSFKFRRNVK